MSQKLRLHTQVAAVCPIHGVGGGPGAYTFVPKDESTTAQRTAAQAAIDAFDPSDAAQTAWEEDQRPERKTVRQAAAQAVADNATFLALANPTNAQILAQVRRLTNQNTAVIRRIIQLD